MLEYYNMNIKKFQNYVQQTYTDLGLLNKHLNESDKEKLTITERLAFLRNVEALHRSSEARKRTYLRHDCCCNWSGWSIRTSRKIISVL